MPLYDCGAEDCEECHLAFGPDRLKAIANYKAREAFYAALPQPEIAQPVAVALVLDRGLSSAEMKAQGKRCGCLGSDDYCVCQNVPDRQTKAEWASTITNGARGGET